MEAPCIFFLAVKIPHFAFSIDPAIQIRLGGSLTDEKNKIQVFYVQKDLNFMGK